MEMITPIQHPNLQWTDLNSSRELLTPYSQKMVLITQETYIELKSQVNYYKKQHELAKEKIKKLEQKIQEKEGKIKDLKKRVFGKKSEKKSSTKNKKGNRVDSSPRKKGQQKNKKGHGRTNRPNLPIIDDILDLAPEDKKCSCCGLPYTPNPALDEESELIEVKVAAHIRRYHRPAYQPHLNCHCKTTPKVITAPPPDKLIPKGSYDSSFWLEIILGKYYYAQPTHRYLQDLKDQGLPVSPGTVAGGLKKIAPLFTPIMEALYCKQMTEDLFHNDETRWEVFVTLEGKVGTRWYLWVTRSASVIYYCIDPSRSTAVPGAHFAGLQSERAIIVCDRYSVYKKLARLSDPILLAFCWAHVRRDFLDAATSFKNLEPWALQFKELIGQLYHLNSLRLEHYNPHYSMVDQSEQFKTHHEAVKKLLQSMYDIAHNEVSINEQENKDAGRKKLSLAGVQSSSEKQKIKVYRSLINHWDGLTLFLENPLVPLDNNSAENSIRSPVNGRKGYYGSGSIWSAHFAAESFSILQTVALWKLNPRHWLDDYLQACAKNKGQPPRNLDSFIPWKMSPERRDFLSRPKPT